MVRPEEFESPAFWFVAKRSIQLSYGRKLLQAYYKMVGDGNFEIPAPRPQTECSASELISVQCQSGEDRTHVVYFPKVVPNR